VRARRAGDIVVDKGDARQDGGGQPCGGCASTWSRRKAAERTSV